MRLPQSVQARIAKRLLEDPQCMDILRTYAEAKELKFFVPTIAVGIVETDKDGKPIEKPAEPQEQGEAKSD